jgi:hypothetical protein
LYITNTDFQESGEVWEEFKDTKGVTRIRKSKKNRKHNAKRKRTKGRLQQEIKISISDVKQLTPQ